MSLCRGDEQKAQVTISREGCGAPREPGQGGQLGPGQQRGRILVEVKGRPAGTVWTR